MNPPLQRWFRASVGWALLAFVIAGAAAAAFVLLRPGRGGFNVGGVAIDPQAPLRGSYRLVLWDAPPPLPPGPSPAGRPVVPGLLGMEGPPHQGYRAALEEAVRAFGEAHPQLEVEVEIQLVPASEMASRLRHALEGGQPPDLAAVDGATLLWPALQVPASPYLPRTQEGAPEYEPALLAAVGVDGVAWAWPRWAQWSAWAVHRDLLEAGGLDVNRVLAQGWTWEEFLDWAEVTQGRVRQPLALNLEDPSLLLHLAANAGPPPSQPAAAGPAALEEPLAQAAGFLRQLLGESLAGPLRPEASRNRVARFLTRRAALLGPVNPLLAASLWERSGAGALAAAAGNVTRQAVPIVLVPVPRREGSAEVATLDVSAYVVFRQDPHRGDGHVRAAAELARFLSRRMNLWLARHVPVMPVSPQDGAAWRAATGLDPLNEAFLRDYLTHAPASPLGRLLSQPPGGEPAARLEPLWSAFWEEETAPASWAARAVEALRPLAGAALGSSR